MTEATVEQGKPNILFILSDDHSYPYLHCYGATEMIYFQNRALIPAQMLSLSRIVEYLLAITFYLQFVFSVFRAIFEGHKDFILPAKISIASSIIQFALIVLIFLVKGNLIFLGLSNLCTTLLQGALFYYFLGKRYSELKIKLCYANYATFKEIAKFSISVQVINLLGSLLDPIIKYIIGSYSDKKMIPAYEIARKFALAISGLYSFTFKNALPNISTLSSTIDYQSFLFSMVFIQLQVNSHLIRVSVSWRRNWGRA